MQTLVLHHYEAMPPSRHDEPLFAYPLRTLTT